MSDVTRAPVMIPSYCESHLYELLVLRLGIPESGPWQSRTVISQMLLFQWVCVDPRFWRRCGNEECERDTHAMNIVLAEIGCLACFAPKGFRVVWQMMRGDLDAAIGASKRGDWASSYFPPIVDGKKEG